jgi:hypothetical protein
MTETEQVEKRLDQLRENYRSAQSYLLSAVAELCPGPHRLAQHRDKLPPWCNSCGRDAMGYQRKSDR